MSAGSVYSKFGFYLLMFLSSITKVCVKNTTITVTNSTAVCSNDCALLCSAKQRIKLNDYKYYSAAVPKGKQVDDPAMLFYNCSWRQNCTVTLALVQGIVDSKTDGSLIIIYSCVALTRPKSFCGSNISTDSPTHLIFHRSHGTETSVAYECSCMVSGKFKLRIVDLRLRNTRDGTCSSTSITTCYSRICDTEINNCTTGDVFNKWLSKNATFGVLTLEKLSDLSWTFMIWIQILKLDGSVYNVNCSKKYLTTTTASSTISTTKITTVSTTKQSTSSAKLTTMENGYSPEMTFSSSTRTLSSESTTVYVAAENTDEKPFPVSAIVVPVTLLVLATASAVGIIVFCRRGRKHKNIPDDNAVANPGYTDTADVNADLTVPVINHNVRSGSLDGGLPEKFTEFNIDLQADDQYNIIENSPDFEYNKITFKENSVPFDENYGHIKAANFVSDKTYDHLDGLPEADTQNYSHVTKPVYIDKKEHTVQKETSNHRTAKVEVCPYDHLAYSGEEITAISIEQDDCYYHMSSSGNREIHHKPKPASTVQAVLKEPSHTFAANSELDNLEHSYFVLEAGVDKYPTQRESYNYASTHPYFIFDPTANNSNIQTENDIKHTEKHSYFDLKPNANSIKADQKAMSNTELDNQKNEQDHYYSALKADKVFEHSYSKLK